MVSFSKALPHNALGEVDADAYRQLLRAIGRGDPSAFALVPVGGTAKLTNPQAAFAFHLEGADSHALTVDPPPGFAEEAFAAEMVECYWRALARDVPYSGAMAANRSPPVPLKISNGSPSSPTSTRRPCSAARSQAANSVRTCRSSCCSPT